MLKRALGFDCGSPLPDGWRFPPGLQYGSTILNPHGRTFSFLGRAAPVPRTSLHLALTSVSVAPSAMQAEEYSSRTVSYFPVPGPLSLPLGYGGKDRTRAGWKDRWRTRGGQGGGDHWAFSLQETGATFRLTSARSICQPCPPVSAIAPCRIPTGRPAACGA